MTKEHNKKLSLSSDSALAKLATLPKVGSGLGGYNISLGFSHRHALTIASQTLKDISKEEANKILGDIYYIFCQWRDEKGVYPPNTGGFFDLNDTAKQYSAKDYCKKLISEAKGREPELPEPWECCPYVTTPIGLFWKIWGDGYSPLGNYFSNSQVDFESVIAILILLSDDPTSEYQSSDCIEAALKLSLLSYEIQKELIERMKPDHEAAFKRRKQKKLKSDTQKEETERRVIAAYEECCIKYGKDQFPLKEISARIDCSTSTVSRYLRKSGLGRYKTD